MPTDVPLREDSPITPDIQTTGPFSDFQATVKGAVQEWHGLAPGGTKD
jgi:hypothetical protein